MARLFVVTLLVCGCALGQPAVQLSVDVSEAEQALRILRKQAAHQSVDAADWQLLFTTIPYQQLRAREASMGRPLADAEFQEFLQSPEALAKLPEWEKALASVKVADLPAIGKRILDWLPAGASIHAHVSPEIKPQFFRCWWGG